MPPHPPNAQNQNQTHREQELPSFVQRQERDTFGVRDHYQDSWGRAEAAKLDMVYETSKDCNF